MVLNLAWLTPCVGMMAVQAGSGNTGQVSAPQSQDQIVNISVSNIDGREIYSADGHQYDISGARVINLRPSGAQVRQAVLDFRNGELVQVILK